MKHRESCTVEANPVALLVLFILDPRACERLSLHAVKSNYYQYRIFRGPLIKSRALSRRSSGEGSSNKPLKAC